MYFYASNTGPPGPGHFGTLDLHLNKLAKDNNWAMLHTKFQASEPSGSEEEDF